MSFLSRSKLNLSDNSLAYFSQNNDRSRNIPVSPNSSELLGSLDGFRQGLRKELTNKLKSPSSLAVNRFVEIPSPKTQKSFKERIETGFGIKQRGSPRTNEPSYPNKTFTSLSTKPSVRQFDLLKDVNKRIEERNSPRRTPSRDLTLLTSYEKKFNPRNGQLSPGKGRSVEKRRKSPLKEYTSSLITKTPENRRAQELKSASSYFDTSFTRGGAGAGGQRDMKQSLINILDTNSISRKPRDSEKKLDSDRPASAMAQAFNQLRSSRIVLGQSPEKRGNGDSKFGTESLRSLSNFVNDNFRNKDTTANRSEKYGGTKRLSLFNGSNDNGISYNFSKRSNISDKFPISKIYEVQDLFQNAGDSEFNSLSGDYVEELIKLSATIMQRVKASSFNDYA